MKILFYISLFFLFQASLFAQNFFNETFQSNNTSENKFAVSQAVIQLSNSNFLIAGQSYDQSKVSVLKLEGNGDTIWSYCSDLGIN